MITSQLITAAEVAALAQRDEGEYHVNDPDSAVGSGKRLLFWLGTSALVALCAGALVQYLPTMMCLMDEAQSGTACARVALSVIPFALVVSIPGALLYVGAWILGLVTAAQRGLRGWFIAILVAGAFATILYARSDHTP
jgi:hypothetical protein